MFEFFIVKGSKDEPFYKASDDICFPDILKAWQQIAYLAETNNKRITDYYIVRLAATNHEEITQCFWAAANGQGAKIKSYKVLNSIAIHEGDP
jgi:hypothetical protein